MGRARIPMKTRLRLLPERTRIRHRVRLLLRWQDDDDSSNGEPTYAASLVCLHRLASSARIFFAFLAIRAGAGPAERAGSQNRLVRLARSSLLSRRDVGRRASSRKLPDRRGSSAAAF